MLPVPKEREMNLLINYHKKKHENKEMVKIKLFLVVFFANFARQNPGLFVQSGTFWADFMEKRGETISSDELKQIVQ